MTLQYTNWDGQPGRRTAPARGSHWSLGGALGSLALHGAALVAAVTLIGSARPASEDPAVIVVFVPPEAPASAAEVPQLPPDFVPPPDEPPPPEFKAVMPELPAPSEPPPSPDFKAPKPAAPSPKVVRVPHQTPTPQPPSSATAAPISPPAAATSVAPNWNASLGAWLASHRTYPEASRKRSEEGDVTVRFTVASDGRVTDVALVKGSGHDALDAAALSMLRSASLPPPGIEATRTIRLRYRLSD